MVRQFPLVTSIDNLVWNIKHYRPHTRRPPFKATRHPFCTNIQLRNASCTYWLKETTKEIGDKIAKQSAKLKPQDFSPAAHKPATSLLLNLQPAALYTTYTSLESTTDSRFSEKDVHPAEIEIVKLFQKGDFAFMYQKLKAYKADGVTVPTEIINEMISSVQDLIPLDNSKDYLYQSIIEVPMFLGKEDLWTLGLYSKLYANLESLYNIFKLYESASISDEKFLQNYIWLCYHMEDLPSLQKLLYQYLKIALYDTRTLSYVVNAFVYSYDVEFAKSLFESIVKMGKPLDESFFSTTLISFIKSDAVFDNVHELFRCWTTADNCESPYPKTIALLLRHYYQHANPTEISIMEAVCEELGYNTNFLVQMVKAQARITNRDNRLKKVITGEDVSNILQARNSISHSKHALKVFYESYLRFFSVYSGMSVMQLILKEMRRDNVPITKFSSDTIIRHYAAEGKLAPLFKFIDKFVSHSNRFELIYAKNIFDTFIESYPYEGEQFTQEFYRWIDNNEHLSDEKKNMLREECKIVKLNSNISPFALQPTTFRNVRKYSKKWVQIHHEPGKYIKAAQRKDQVRFRIEEGIVDMMRRGITPDYRIIENTLRNVNASARNEILKSLQGLRMTKHSTRLEILDLVLSYPTKEELAKFVKLNESKFNTSDKLFLARRVLNTNDASSASRMLESLDEAELTGTRPMQALHLRLRSYISANNFAKCDRTIKEFPINSVALSPYVFKHCRYVEKVLKKKIMALEANAESHLFERLDEMKGTLENLKGLIGDIDARIKKDQVDIKVLMSDIFAMLDRWIQESNKMDERKV